MDLMLRTEVPFQSAFHVSKEAGSDTPASLDHGKLMLLGAGFKD